MRLSAIDAVQRGLTNLRSNRELIVLQMVQGGILAVLSVAGAVPIVLALGVGALRSLMAASASPWGRSTGSPADLSPYIERMFSNWPLLLAAVFGALCIWTLAFLVYCYFQAGVMGELAAGDAKAAALGKTRPDRADFRVFSLAGFNSKGQAKIWQFFWLINIFVTLALLIVLVLSLVLSGVVAWAFKGGSTAAAVGLGCLSALFLAPVWVFLSLWGQLAKALLVSSASGFWSAFRESFSLLFRRLGAVLLIAVLAFVAGVAVSMVFVPVSLAADFGLGDSFRVQITADVVLMVVQTVISAVLGAAVAAVFIALARSEGKRPESDSEGALP
ncbi:MAG: hypothetical protein OES47_11355 [Acidobacteriota bacterium]|nr:hypothetical protein [Acidobacteriota bacterium]